MVDGWRGTTEIDNNGKQLECGIAHDKEKWIESEGLGTSVNVMTEGEIFNSSEAS